MKFKNQIEWDSGLAKNQDDYGGAVYEYAEKWADLMESRMADGAELIDIAKDTSFEVAEEIGITGFMYGAAVSVLATCWKHGKTLRQWHNLGTQIRNEGEEANKQGGVLNPAVLNIG